MAPKDGKRPGCSADQGMAQFLKDLLESVRQMKSGKAARTILVSLRAAAEARAKESNKLIRSW